MNAWSRLGPPVQTSEVDTAIDGPSTTVHKQNDLFSGIWDRVFMTLWTRLLVSLRRWESQVKRFSSGSGRCLPWPTTVQYVVDRQYLPDMTA